MSEPSRAARRRIRRDHATVLEGIDACADRVAASWDGDAATDRADVVDPLRAELESMGVLARLPDVLVDAVDATGHALPASPVAAPPYVAVTSRGPVLRATIDPGRLVVRVDAFEVVRESTPRYRRLEDVRLAVSLE